MAEKAPNKRILQEDFLTAVKVYTARLREDPHDAVALVNRATAFLMSEMYRKAFIDADQAILSDSHYLKGFLLKGNTQTNPLSFTASSLRFLPSGVALLNMRRLEDALLVLEAGIAVGESNGDFVDYFMLNKAVAKAKSLLKAQVTRFPTPWTPWNVEEKECTPSKPGPDSSSSASGKAAAAASKDAKSAKTSSLPEKVQKKPSKDYTGKFTLQEKQRLQMADPGNPRISIGHGFVNMGKLNEAIALFTEILESAPTSTEAYLGRGSAYALLGKYAEAIEDFTSCLKIVPYHADALKRRGQVKGALGLAEHALEDLTKARRYCDFDEDILLQRGALYHKMKDHRCVPANLEAFGFPCLMPASGGPLKILWL